MRNLLLRNSRRIGLGLLFCAFSSSAFADTQVYSVFADRSGTHVLYIDGEGFIPARDLIPSVELAGQALTLLPGYSDTHLEAQLPEALADGEYQILVTQTSAKRRAPNTITRVTYSLTLGASGTGSPGDKGPVGDKGPAGDKGPTGDKGPAGDAGTGSPGDQGPAGDKGPTGDKGPVGDKGPDGNAGSAGANGDKGPAGDKGPVGDKGATGDKGLSGDKGSIGDKGLAGDKGLTGDKGTVGDKGLSGDKGLTGDKGATGDKGPTGNQGAAGSNGVLGSALTTCSNATTCTCSSGGLLLSGGAVCPASGADVGYWLHDSAPSGTSTWSANCERLGDGGAATPASIKIICVPNAAAP